MILIPYRITEKFIRQNGHLTFVYSTDTFNRGGLGMQWHMAGPSNSFGVPVLYKYCANPIYFTDKSGGPYISNLNLSYGFDYNKSVIDEAIRLIPKDNPIVVPPKLGLGCARMMEYCPKTYKYLRQELDKIKSNDIKIDYSYL